MNTENNLKQLVNKKHLPTHVLRDCEFCSKFPISEKSFYEKQRKRLPTLRFFNLKNPQINFHSSNANSTKITILAPQTYKLK